MYPTRWEESCVFLARVGFLWRSSYYKGTKVKNEDTKYTSTYILLGISRTSIRHESQLTQLNCSLRLPWPCRTNGHSSSNTLRSCHSFRRGSELLLLDFSRETRKPPSLR